MDNICDYDEAYERRDAYDIGWCEKCQCNPQCLYKKKAIGDSRKIEWSETVRGFYCPNCFTGTYNGNHICNHCGQQLRNCYGDN